MTEKKIKTLNLVKRILFIIIIAYIVLFVVMNISYLSFDNLKRFAYSAKAAVTNTYTVSNDGFVLESEKEGLWIQYKDGYAFLNDSELSVYSCDNVCFSTEKIGYSNPVLRSSEKYILCYDRGSASLSVHDSFRTVYKYSGSDNIINAAVNDDGRVALITEKNGFKGGLTVLDKSFNAQFIWNCADAYPIDVYFSGKNTVSVVTVSQNAEKMVTSVVTFFYQSGKEKNSASYEGSFPLKIYPKSDGSVEILYETGVESFRSGGVNSIFEFDSFTPELYCQGTNISVLTYNSDDYSDLSTVIALDLFGNVLFTVPYSGVRAVSSYYDSVIVLGTGVISVFDKTGSEVSRLETEDVYSSIYLGKNHIVFTYGSKAKICKISTVIK